MINFDAVDFSERRPKEVMFLLTLSVDGFPQPHGSYAYVADSLLLDYINPFSTGTGWTLYKVYGGFTFSYGTG